MNQLYRSFFYMTKSCRTIWSDLLCVLSVQFFTEHQWVMYRKRQLPWLTHRQYRHARACLSQIWLRWVKRLNDVPAHTHTHIYKQKSLHLQLHHGVLAQLVPACRCHLINPDQLGLVAHAISAETLNKPRLTAVLTCSSGRDGGKKRGQEISKAKNEREWLQETRDVCELEWILQLWYHCLLEVSRWCVCVCVCVCVSVCVCWLPYKYLWNRKCKINSKLAAASKIERKLNLKLNWSWVKAVD